MSQRQWKFFIKTFHPERLHVTANAGPIPTVSLQKPHPSGAWQKYSYRRRDGIIEAKNSSVLPKGYSYDHRRFAVPCRIPQGAADRTTTGLLGADCAPSDQSPASGATRQDSVGAGDGSHPVPGAAPAAPQARDGTCVAPAVARPRLQARAD